LVSANTLRGSLKTRLLLAILPDLTDADLMELGVTTLGHRRLLLRGIAELDGVEKPTATHATTASAPVTPQQGDTAQRRQLTVITALSARLDPEDLQTTIGAITAAVPT
jgi:hypothetical protein